MKAISEVYVRLIKNLHWQDGLVQIPEPGHTKEASQHQVCHEGRTSADYYSIGSLLGQVDEECGISILKELSALQIRDPQHKQYGGMRWYREETMIHDTNAAFFIMMPITTIRFLYPEAFPDRHIGLIDTMMEASLAWFAHECRVPILYYPNKIISDGALLLTLSRIRNHEIYYQEAVGFFEKWEAYTVDRGWGWGENISLHYLSIILNALGLACKVLKESDYELKLKLEKQIEDLLAYIRFHGTGELVPTIRSYNFNGKAEKASFLWIIAGLKNQVMDEVKQDSIVNNWSLTNIITLLLFDQHWKEQQVIVTQVPRSRKELIFDQSYSFTWIGKNGRLGSINKFPVIPGSYQWPTWGLGWQSFPVSYRIEGEQVGYLRWFVKESGLRRTHPAEKFQSYLNPALFGEEWYPDVQTRCAQQDHMLLVYRSMEGIHNQMAELVDEWVIHRYQGEIQQLQCIEGGSTRTWIVLLYKKAAIAITSLRGIPYAQKERVDQVIHVQRENDTLLLRQELYRGEEQVIHHPRLESGWAVIFLDDISNQADIQQRLNRVKITDVSKIDGEVPRTTYTEIRHIEMTDTAGHVSLTIDPFNIST